MNEQIIDLLDLLLDVTETVREEGARAATRLGSPPGDRVTESHLYGHVTSPH